jgi:hypothetical protein
MALDFNSVKFLFWARNLGVSCNRTLTLGRMGLSCTPRQVRRALGDFNLSGTRGEVDRCFRRTFGENLYADEFFRFLGAKEIVSADYSNYEEATLLHDLNKPFPENLRGGFDLVMDGGTLEHIFDFPSALRHCLELVSVGGHFITITPANQWMGHGFYQFSPELYFRVFDAGNGFRLRKIVLFDCLKADATFYEVKDPALIGKRVQLSSRKLMTMAVLAEKTAEVPIFAHPPQQSDYVAVWNEHQRKEEAAAGTKTAGAGLFHRLRVAVNPYWPYWLRYLKSRFSHFRNEGRHSLNNTSQFRRLSREEIARERSGRTPA